MARKSRKSHRLNMLLVVLVGVTLLVAFFVIRNNGNNVLSEFETSTGMGGPVYSTVGGGTASGTTCQVVNLTVSNYCGNDSFRNASYTCTYGSATQGGDTSCKPISTWYEYAKNDCASKCPQVTTQPYTPAPYSPAPYTPAPYTPPPTVTTQPYPTSIPGTTTTPPPPYPSKSPYPSISAYPSAYPKSFARPAPWWNFWQYFQRGRSNR